MEAADCVELPVVDDEGKLVGTVTAEDAMEVLRDEATEDMERMAAILPSERPYLKTSVWEIYKKRVLWLLLLMVSAAFTGAIITHYETALAAQVVLTAFIPMLMDTGGNCGSQSSVTIIRGLSLGEIGYGDLVEGGLEGDTGRSAVWDYPGRCQSAATDCFGPPGFDSGHSGQPDFGSDGDCIKAAGLFPAYSGQPCPSGPCCDGQPLDHHHRGWDIPDGILSYRRPAS